MKNLNLLDNINKSNLKDNEHELMNSSCSEYGLKIKMLSLMNNYKIICAYPVRKIGDRFYQQILYKEGR